MALVLYHLVDALLEGVLSDEAVDEDVLVLADTVGAVGGLCLDGGVPLEVEVYDVACGSEVEAGAGGFQREEEDAVAARVLLEAVHHRLALLDATAAVEEKGTLARALLYHLLEHQAHLAELGKYEHLLTALDNALQQREKHLGLAGELGGGVASMPSMAFIACSRTSW